MSRSFTKIADVVRWQGGKNKVSFQWTKNLNGGKKMHPFMKRHIRYETNRRAIIKKNEQKDEKAKEVKKKLDKQK